MQHVYRNADNRHDKNGAHKNMRSFFTRKPDQFMAQMRDLEDKHLAAIEAAKAQQNCAGQGGQAEELIDDMGAEEALRIIEETYQKELAKVKCLRAGIWGLHMRMGDAAEPLYAWARLAVSREKSWDLTFPASR
jgi:hypothetical protein